MKKWIIRKIKTYRDFWLNYNWFIKFQIWDNIFESSNVDSFLNDYKNKYYNIESVAWCDFKVLREYRQSDGFVFEIELISRVFNSSWVLSYLYYNES